MFLEKNCFFSKIFFGQSIEVEAYNDDYVQESIGDQYGEDKVPIKAEIEKVLRAPKCERGDFIEVKKITNVESSCCRNAKKSTAI
ncbi:MAG: hypothetical protein LW808_003885 [Verrucomicrobiota bacterium]|nr:MAG: hypothetical protein LW808_003885 [Verrucomicrobiota bacterium]